MSPMVERIARRLAAAAGKDPDGVAWNGYVMMETGGIHWWHHYVPSARVAIEAMREATSEMARAAQPEVNLSADVGHYECLSVEELFQIWSAMVDVALQEGESR